jgi:hypothetical protein
MIYMNYDGLLYDDSWRDTPGAKSDGTTSAVEHLVMSMSDAYAVLAEELSRQRKRMAKTGSS